MVKATRRSAVLLGLIALGLGVSSLPAFAEVQNVKVSGDLTVRAFERHNFDLRANSGALDDQTFLQSTTGLNFGADLTENVSAFVRMVNERDWNQDTAATGEFGMSQAYVTLKELFYSPLTVRIGTQPIKWGRGFILGSSMLPNTLSTTNPPGGDRNGSITANELTDFTAFDAIRATLDLSGVAGVGIPLNVDGVYIKLKEGNTNTHDDVNILGLNVGTHADAMHSEAEGYFITKRDGGPIATAGSGLGNESGETSAFGFRGSVQPVEGVSTYGELAYEFGTRVTALGGGTSQGGGTSGWAANLGGDYTFAHVAMTPKIGGEWVFYSGKENAGGPVSGWEPFAPSYFTTMIRSYQTRSTVTGLYPVFQAGVTSGFTNQSELALYGSLKPIEDLSVGSRLSWFAEVVGSRVPPASGNRHAFLGTEWDTHLTYAYTDDVQFGVSYGIFVPGTTFRDAGDNGSRNTAQELMSSVSVKF